MREVTRRFGVNLGSMIEKIIEAYAIGSGGLDFSRPAFDIRFHQGGTIDSHIHNHEWSDLGGRIVFDIGEQIQPRGKLNESSTKAVSQFQSLAQKVKLPPALRSALEGLPTSERKLRSFEEMLGWLTTELEKVGLGFRVTVPGGG